MLKNWSTICVILMSAIKSLLFTRIVGIWNCRIAFRNKVHVMETLHAMSPFINQSQISSISPVLTAIQCTTHTSLNLPGKENIVFEKLLDYVWNMEQKFYLQPLEFWSLNIHFINSSSSFSVFCFRFSLFVTYNLSCVWKSVNSKSLKLLNSYRIPVPKMYVSLISNLRNV